MSSSLFERIMWSGPISILAWLLMAATFLFFGYRTVRAIVRGSALDGFSVFALSPLVIGITNTSLVLVIELPIRDQLAGMLDTIPLSTEIAIKFESALYGGILSLILLILAGIQAFSAWSRMKKQQPDESTVRLTTASDHASGKLLIAASLPE